MRKALFPSSCLHPERRKWRSARHPRDGRFDKDKGGAWNEIEAKNEKGEESGKEKEAY